MSSARTIAALAFSPARSSKNMFSSLPQLERNGVFPVISETFLFIASCANSSSFTQLSCLKLVQCLRYISKDQFILSVYLSVYEQYVVDILSLIPSAATRVFQKFNVKSLSLSDVIVFGILYSRTILSSKIYTICGAVYVSLNRIRTVYFISLSTITIIELQLMSVVRSFDFSSLTIKSIVMSSYSVVSTVANLISLYFACRADLFFQHSGH